MERAVGLAERRQALLANEAAPATALRGEPDGEAFELLAQHVEVFDVLALQGTQGAPDNYGLLWVEVDTEFSTPRHRHNVEQVRILLEGEVGFGPEQVQTAGTVGYFCEGTYPTQAAEGRSVTLLLQVGRPSGQGFMNRAQLRAGIGEHSQEGSFHDGVHTWLDAAGKKHNQDSFEAVWKRVHGQPVRYPKPQFDAPVLMTPERFEWLALPDAPGVRVRPMARFHGRGLEIGPLAFDAGTCHVVDARDQGRLLFRIDGAGTAHGERWHARSAIECTRGETMTLMAEQASRFRVPGLPVFDPVDTGTSAASRPTSRRNSPADRCA